MAKKDPDNLWSTFASFLVENMAGKSDGEKKKYLEAALREVAESKKSELEQVLKDVTEFSELVSHAPIAEILKWQKRVDDNLLRSALKSGKFSELLPSNSNVEACILSLDIRRSTDLMFQARSNEKFVAFLTTLIEALTITVQRRFGVVEKFTGDGLLCYFPIDFSGDEYVLAALLAAQDCIENFNEIYRLHWSDFECPISNTGISAGIAVGDITVTPAFGGISIVGKPVVMACRLNAGSRGEIWGTVQAGDAMRYYPVFGTTYATFEKSKLEPFTACRFTSGSADEIFSIESKKPRWYPGEYPTPYRFAEYAEKHLGLNES